MIVKNNFYAIRTRWIVSIPSRYALANSPGCLEVSMRRNRTFDSEWIIRLRQQSFIVTEEFLFSSVAFILSRLRIFYNGFQDNVPIIARLLASTKLKKSKWKKNRDTCDLSNRSIDFKRSMSKVYIATIRWNWWHCQLVRQWRNYRCHR